MRRNTPPPKGKGIMHLVGGGGAPSAAKPKPLTRAFVPILPRQIRNRGRRIEGWLRDHATDWYSVTQIATATGTHSNTVRKHCRALVLQGMVTVAPRPRGNSPWLFRWVPEEERRVVDNVKVIDAARLLGHGVEREEDT